METLSPETTIIMACPLRNNRAGGEDFFCVFNLIVCFAKKWLDKSFEKEDNKLMKKLIALLLCLFCFAPTANLSHAETEQMVYVVNACYVYETASFDTKKLDGDQPVKLLVGQSAKLKEEEGDFWLVESGEIEGYVYKYCLTKNAPQEDVYLNFNATVERTATIYDLEMSPAFQVKKGQRVYLYQGYSKDEYTKVALLRDDGTPFYGFIATNDIVPDGINAGLITGIAVIISCLTLIFLLLFMKKKKGSKS